MQLVDRYQKLVDFFGSQILTASSLGVTQPSVNAWLVGKTKMSPKVAITAEKVTKGEFKAVDLCPELKGIL